MGDDAFCGVPGVKSYLQKDEREEEGLCTGKRTAQNRSSRQCTKKQKVLLYIFVQRKMEKLREKYGIRGYIYIYILTFSMRK